MGRSGTFAVLPMLLIAGFSMGLASALAGAGYTLPFLISGVVARWGVQVPFLFLVVNVLKLPFFFTALSFTVAELAGGAVLFIAHLRGRWRTWRVTKTEDKAKPATA